MWQSLFGSEAEILAAEKAVGHDLYVDVVQQTVQTGDSGLQTRVSDVAVRLARHVRAKGREFRTLVIQDSQANAFALPGGYVFITSAILDLCHRQEDQIAFIIAHEMAHIIKQHAMERIAVHSAVSVASNLPSFRTAVSGWVRRVGTSALQSAYSQDHELDADAWAICLSRAAGFDAGGGIELLSSLARGDAPAEPGSLGQYFSSHPPLALRIAVMKRALQTSADH